MYWIKEMPPPFKDDCIAKYIPYREYRIEKGKNIQIGS